MAPRRILGIGVAAVVVLLLLVAVLWPSLRGDTVLSWPSLNPSRPPAPAERHARGEAGTTAPTATPSPAASPEAGAEPTPAGLGDLLDEPKMASVARLAADEYRQRARYPRFSQPLVDGEDPILRKRQVSPIHARGEGGAEPVLSALLLAALVLAVMARRRGERWGLWVIIVSLAELSWNVVLLAIVGFGIAWRTL